LPEFIRKLVPTLLLSAILVVGFACSDDNDNDSQNTGSGGGGAESAVCNDLSSVQSSVNDLKNLSSSSTVSDAQTAVNNVKGSLDQLDSSADSAVQGQVDSLKSGFSSLQSAIQNIPSGQTLGVTATAIQAGVSGVQQALDQVGSKGNCS
jgi:hypothetical protein